MMRDTNGHKFGIDVLLNHEQNHEHDDELRQELRQELRVPDVRVSARAHPRHVYDRHEIEHNFCTCPGCVAYRIAWQAGTHGTRPPSSRGPSSGHVSRTATGQPAHMMAVRTHCTTNVIHPICDKNETPRRNTRSNRRKSTQKAAVVGSNVHSTGSKRANTGRVRA